MNIVHLSSDLRARAIEKGFFEASLAPLSNFHGPHPDLFVRLRWVFLCTADRAGAEQLIAHPTALSHLLQVILH